MFRVTFYRLFLTEVKFLTTSSGRLELFSQFSAEIKICLKEENKGEGKSILFFNINVFNIHHMFVFSFKIWWQTKLRKLCKKYEPLLYYAVNMTMWFDSKCSNFFLFVGDIYCFFMGSRGHILRKNIHFHLNNNKWRTAIWIKRRQSPLL